MEIGLIGGGAWGHKILCQLRELDCGVVVFDPSASNIQATMGVLIGDTTADGVVNSTDVSQTQSQLRQPVTASNFRDDVNADGVINPADAYVFLRLWRWSLLPLLRDSFAICRRRPRSCHVLR